MKQGGRQAGRPSDIHTVKEAGRPHIVKEGGRQAGSRPLTQTHTGRSPLLRVSVIM